MILDEVAQRLLFLLTYRSFQRNRRLRDLHGLANLTDRQTHFLGDLFGSGLAAVLLDQSSIGLRQFIDHFNHMHRDSDGPALIENALDFSKILVTNWLAKYKFRTWATHSTTQNTVTEEDRKQRAEEIATKLCDHSRWLTHARSIKIDDLEDMKLRITNYSTAGDLADAIRRYYTLLQMTFSGNMYKVFETPKSQIYRFQAPVVPAPAQQPAPAEAAIIDAKCLKCGTTSRVQANLGKKQPLQEGSVPFPADNKFHCPNCGTETDLSDVRRQLEAQSKKKVVP